MLVMMAMPPSTTRVTEITEADIAALLLLEEVLELEFGIETVKWKTKPFLQDGFISWVSTHYYPQDVSMQGKCVSNNSTRKALFNGFLNPCYAIR